MGTITGVVTDAIATRWVAIARISTKYRTREFRELKVHFFIFYFCVDSFFSIVTDP